uniref:Uncharacterized protein n=1 Tax=Proboscia inermis TaxID=420281 RepID=A0A7S0C566_9STRA|mmetsp:Transcript_27856/g.28257  ORF Transcript_27856/g.28257 Transcript_27856/m.28257 type:complete len:140 (+) Transcript_27856:379-798(+)
MWWGAHLESPLTESDSLWELYLHEILPRRFSRGNSSKVVTDVSSSFNETLYLLEVRVTGGEVVEMLGGKPINVPTASNSEYTGLLPEYVVSTVACGTDRGENAPACVELEKSHDVYIHEVRCHGVGTVAANRLGEIGER